MSEQIPLEGITPTHVTDLPKHGLFRRESDRASGCTRYADTAGGYLWTTSNSGGVLPVTIFTLGRFSLLINGEAADFGRKAPRRPLELLKAIIAQGG